MLDIGKILKRSWYVLWNYRVLWIFGFLLALTTGMSSSSNGSSRSTAPARVNTLPAGINTENVPQWGQQLIQWFGQNIEPLYTHPAEHVDTIVTIAVIVFLVLLLLCALGALIRYPAETASIRMVDEYEQTGIKMKFKQGWKLGWTRRAFRLWPDRSPLEYPGDCVGLTDGWNRLDRLHQQVQYHYDGSCDRSGHLAIPSFDPDSHVHFPPAKVVCAAGCSGGSGS